MWIMWNEGFRLYFQIILSRKQLFHNTFSRETCLLKGWGVVFNDLSLPMGRYIIAIPTSLGVEVISDD